MIFRFYTGEDAWAKAMLVEEQNHDVNDLQWRGKDISRVERNQEHGL